MKKIPQITSEQLYELCASGSELGWSIASRYVYGVIKRMDSELNHQQREDLMQTTIYYFLKRGLHEIEKPEAFKMLLRKKALCNILDMKKSPMAQEHIPVAHDESDNKDSAQYHHNPGTSHGGDEGIIWNQVVAECMNVVNTMKVKDEGDRALLKKYLIYKVRGEDLSKISDEMNEPKSKIDSRIYRCLKEFLKHPRTRRLKDDLCL